MVYKYFVPSYDKRYNKKVLYVKILDKIEMDNNNFACKVQILNNNKSIDILFSEDLKKLNILEKIYWGFKNE